MHPIVAFFLIAQRVALLMSGPLLLAAGIVLIGKHVMAHEYAAHFYFGPVILVTLGALALKYFTIVAMGSIPTRVADHERDPDFDGTALCYLVLETPTGYSWRQPVTPEGLRRHPIDSYYSRY